jgi:RNA-directed DNA polymerase
MTTTLKQSVEKWKDLPWKTFDRELFRLQQRIYKAARKTDIKSVHKLQSLVFGSASSRYLAVRQVTQLNRKNIAGIDGLASFNPEQRLQLAVELKKLSSWKHQKLRVYIPKHRNQRPLSIPIIKDRAMQCLLKYALEPVYEAYASGSYGFRRRSTDIQKQIFINLLFTANGFEKRVLILDIEKCFDKIDHKKFMSMVILPGSAKKILWTVLHAGVLKLGSKTLEDTPPVAVVGSEKKANAREASKGGDISPLLCNIALHGIEDLNETVNFAPFDPPVFNRSSTFALRSTGYVQPATCNRLREDADTWDAWDGDAKDAREAWASCDIYQPGYRYSNNLIFFIKPKQDIKRLRKKINAFLLERGLNVNQQKTRLVNVKDGFDFLGWHFVTKTNRKWVSYPSKDNYHQMIVKMKYTLRDTRYPMDQRLDKARVVFQGWRNYHQYCNMSEINVWPIRYWTNQYLKRYSKMNRQQRTEKVLFIFGNFTYKVNNFVAIRKHKSIYDNH